MFLTFFLDYYHQVSRITVVILAWNTNVHSSIIQEVNYDYVLLKYVADGKIKYCEVNDEKNS
jgi:hypothetical protein